MSPWKRRWCDLVVRISRNVPSYHRFYEISWDGGDRIITTKLPRVWCRPHLGRRVLGERLFAAYVDECTAFVAQRKSEDKIVAELRERVYNPRSGDWECGHAKGRIRGRCRSCGVLLFPVYSPR